MITLKQIREAELEVSKGNPIPSEAAAKGLSLEKLMVYEAAKADMASRVDRVLDRHIESAGGGGEVGDMIEEAAGEFFRLTEMENAMPVRSMELLEITCVDFLGAAGRRFFDCEGRPAKSVDESLPGRRYARELPSGSRSSGRAGSITACGEKLDGFDRDLSMRSPKCSIRE